MTKRLIELDDEMLEEARQALGTEGVSDTVRAALRHVADAVARSQEVEWLAAGGMADLAKPQERASVWR